ncbi:MAG: hypothetical protein GXP33_14960 [Spirochaetes bacterium]|nr:hypothetical protein [Spirochaetota bacterium]
MLKESQKEYKSLHLIGKPVLWGIIAGTLLLLVYFSVLTFANSLRHAVEQFKEMWYWVVLLVAGFGTQAGLYTYIRTVFRLRKESGIAASTVAAAGGISTTSMIACCAHHVTDFLPVLGISAAMIFFNQFQNLFIITGVLSNVIGINLMLKIIQEHNLYQKGTGVFSVIMEINMKKTLYVTGIFSVFAFLATLYISL